MHAETGYPGADPSGPRYNSIKSLNLGQCQAQIMAHEFDGQRYVNASAHQKEWGAGLIADLSECLQTCGVSPEEPAFFSWLGVSMYLNEPAVDSTLKVLGAFPFGSEAVLTFLHPDDLKRATGKRMVRRVSDLGEHFISGFDEDSLGNKLRHHGFSTVDFLSHQEAKARYFLNGRCSLPAPKRPGLAAAIRL